MSDQPPSLTRAQLREQPLELTEDQRALVQEVVTQLNETSHQALRQIEALVYYCGGDVVFQTLQEALEVEASGGMLVSDGKRRRTPGGVFFYLISRRITPEQLKITIRLYQSPPEKKKKSGKKPGSASRQAASAPKVVVPAPDWEIYHEMLPELTARQGVATTVKITLIGRPGNVKIQQETVVTSFEHTVKTSGLPKGVPMPPSAPTIYTVYIGLKQWRKVENAIKNPDDALIIEGVCTFDSQIGGMVVFASNVTSKTLEAARRQSKAESASGSVSSPAAPSTARQSSQPSQNAQPSLDQIAPPPPAPTLQDRYPVPPGVPAEVAQKLVDLYSAADQFRHKLAAMETLPPDQRLAYGMTQKLLKNTEDQIASIERKYKA